MAAKPKLDLLLGGDADDEKAPESGGEMPAEDESTEDFDSAASELLAAVKSGDESAFKESLKACIMCCK